MPRSGQSAALSLLVLLSASQVVRHVPALAAHPRIVLGALVVAVVGIVVAVGVQRPRE